MKDKNMNTILFVLCVLCAIFAVVCAAYYMWHQMNWRDETKEVRIMLTEEQELIETLVEQISSKKEAALANQQSVSDSEAALTQQMLDADKLVQEDIAYATETIKGLLRRDAYSGGRVGLIEDLQQMFGKNEESSVVKNLCPRMIVANHSDFGIGMYEPTAYSFSDLTAACIGNDNAGRKYIGVVTYRIGAEYTDWLLRRVGLFFTVSGDTDDTRTLSLGDGYLAGVIE